MIYATSCCSRCFTVSGNAWAFAMPHPWWSVRPIAVVVSRLYAFKFFVVRILSYCFDSLRLLRLVTSKCCILNLWSVLSWFHTLDLYSSATGTTSCAGRTILIPGPKFCCGRWVWLILSGGLILKCDFCMYFLLNSPFYGWYDWLCRSYPYYIVFSVEAWNVLVYPKLVMISKISCVGRTVIYLSIIYF